MVPLSLLLFAPMAAFTARHHWPRAVPLAIGATWLVIALLALATGGRLFLPLTGPEYASNAPAHQSALAHEIIRFAAMFLVALLAMLALRRARALHFPRACAATFALIHAGAAVSILSSLGFRSAVLHQMPDAAAAFATNLHLSSLGALTCATASVLLASLLVIGIYLRWPKLFTMPRRR